MNFSLTIAILICVLAPIFAQYNPCSIDNNACMPMEDFDVIFIFDIKFKKNPRSDKLHLYYNNRKAYQRL